MKCYTEKIMLTVGAVYLVTASPFIFGILEPSLHAGPYAAIFTLLNLPAFFVVSGPLKCVEGILPRMTLRMSNLLALAAFLIFWLVLALLIGLLVDWHRRKKDIGKLT